MPEINQNLSAPWRMKYLDELRAQGAAAPGGCFLCSYAGAPADDAANFVLWRGARTLTLLNRYPYTNGHLLIAPLTHTAQLESLAPAELLELMQRICDAKRVLDAALQPEGYNIGMNLGHCAGAGLPAHLHWHIVPRWGGDTNFMSVVADVRMLPQTHERLSADFLATAGRLGLPKSSG